MEFRFTKHALEKLFERKISPAECKISYFKGEIIEEYVNDSPFPSELRLATINHRILHIVTAKSDNTIHVITAYEPDPKLWSDDFKKRKK